MVVSFPLKKHRNSPATNSPQKHLLVRDPIHGFVRIDRYNFITQLVSTEEFQRLHRISQLGVSRVVYPSATHTRFSHSLGVMRVLERILDNLILLGDIPKDESSHLMKNGMAAALLHDLGHGPLSHCSEAFFRFKHEEISAQLIERPPISDIVEKAEIDPRNIVDILRGTASGSDMLLSQLVSSELDSDRLDYLARDSYFAGVGFGNVDLERIIGLMRIFKGREPLGNHAITPFKGRYSLESYILGRHHMYQAVYFHKATRGAEKLIDKAFQRVKERISRAPSIPDSLEFLDGSNVPTYEEISAMDDHDVFGALRLWQRSRDRILRGLCKRFFQRNLLKAIELDEKQMGAYMTGVDQKLRKLARSHGIDPEYFCPIDLSSETPYKPYSIKPKEDKPSVITNIFLYKEDGEPVEISRVSDVVNSLSKAEYRNRLYMPVEIRNEARNLFKQS